MCCRAQLSRFVLAAACFAALAAPAFTQQAELDALAAKVAEKISKRKKHVAVIPEFRVAKEGVHPLGAVATAEFIASLRRVAPTLQCMDQASVFSRAQGLNILQEDTSNWYVISSLAAGAGAEVGIIGTLTVEPSSSKLKIVLIDLKVFSRASGHSFWEEFGKLESPVPMPSEWEELRKKPAEKTPSRFVAFSRAKGDSYLECLKCPDHTFSDDARKNRIQGTVVVLVTINSRGDPQDLLVLIHPGHGLAQAALETVRHWKFKPARHKDGTPFSTRIMVDVVFRFSQ